MSFTVIIFLLVALFLIRKVNRTIKAGKDDIWNTAREVEPYEDQQTGNTVQPADDRPAELKPEPVSGKESAARPQPTEDPAKHKTSVQGRDFSTKEPVFVKPANVERLFGLVGKPLGHSTSMVSFKKRFREGHISADYVNFELDNASQVRFLAEKYPNLCGLNVTIPYKVDVMQYLDRVDDTAREVGAVNTIRIIRDKDRIELVGFNTDVAGFSGSLKPMLPDNPVKALILGTGGASRAVKYALDKMGIENKFVSRNSTFDILGYYELSPSVMEDYRLIVNCTPVGMFPDTDKCPDIPYTYLTPGHILFDLIYNPEITLFMKKGLEHGASVKNGAEMLRIQADEAWKIWNK